jgi:hypothetical protein
MADAVSTELYDGARNVVQTMTDISDGTGLNLATFFTASALSPNPGVHLKVRRVQFSITNMIVTLYWAGSPNVAFASMGQGESVLDWSRLYSGGLQNPNSGGSASGNILISAQTIGSATAGFTITLEGLKGVRSIG